MSAGGAWALQPVGASADLCLPYARIAAHEKHAGIGMGWSAPREGLINSPQMRDTIALCRGFIHAADVR